MCNRVTPLSSNCSTIILFEMVTEIGKESHERRVLWQTNPIHILDEIDSSQRCNIPHMVRQPWMYGLCIFSSKLNRAFVLVYVMKGK